MHCLLSEINWDVVDVDSELSPHEIAMLMDSEQFGDLIELLDGFVRNFSADRIAVKAVGNMAHGNDAIKFISNGDGCCSLVALAEELEELEFILFNGT